jgi:CheY-like chemotaxis protein
MRKILVVDDDPAVRDVFKTKLESAGGFLIVIATGGKEGVRLAETELPDIILCDIDMPDMDGGTVAAEIGRSVKAKHIPIIFVSSIITPEEAAAGAMAGRWPVLSKRSPFSAVLKKVEDVLGANP